MSLSGTYTLRSARRRALSAAAITAMLLLAPPARHAVVVAQTSAGPAVRVTRDLRFSGRVWPADLNRDGITDLVSSSPATFSNGVFTGGNIQVAIGRGDGTFNDPVRSAFQGGVLGAADFNGDGNIDVIALSVPVNSESSVVILPGNGTATLGPARPAAPASEDVFALSADMDGDGKRDLITQGAAGIAVHPGHGDFTFGTPALLADFNAPIEGITADFNGDGRRDLAIVNLASSVSIFLNQGALLFSAADIAMPHAVSDATAADVNGDGRIDLLVSAGRFEEGFNFGSGFVLVLPGNGNGTFGAPIEYPVAIGPRQIVAGDFNRDGIIDIATGNRSSINRDDCAESRKTWDSVSILRGVGNGTFTGPSNFSIGDQSNSNPADNDGDRYRNTLASLNTSDLNGDRATDLIASEGALLINVAATTNRPPTVNAGSDTLLQNTRETVLRPTASDPDDDMLTWEIRDETGRLLANYPNACYQQLHVGANTITVTVDDGHGHRASDSVVYTVESTDPPSVTVDQPSQDQVVPPTPLTIRWTASAGGSPIARFDLFSSVNSGAAYTAIAECTGLGAALRECVWQHPGPASNGGRIKVTATDTAGRSADGISGVFTVVDANGSTLPEGWRHADIGTVAAAGTSRFDSSLWTVSGSGADIWSTADEFQFAYRAQKPAFEIETRVETIQNVHPWTKAGLMVRTSLDANAAQASVFVTPGNGVSFQRRRSTGAISLHTTKPGIVAPVWLRLTGFNGTVRAYYKKNLTDRWTLLGQDTLANYPSAADVSVGLAVTSHADGTLAKATLSHVRAGELPQWVGPRAVGSNTASAAYDGTDYAITARGSDIWSVGDAFAYLWTSTAGVPESTIVARVVSIDNTNQWAKSGVMFRESATPGSKHVFAMVTPGKGVNLQYRPQTGGQSFGAGTVAGVAPRWLKLQRAGNTFSASYSIDGVTFVQFGTVTMQMGDTVTVGLAHTTHDNAVAGTARFDSVQLIQPGFVSQ